MTVDRNYRGVRSEVTFGEEEPTEFVLGSTISGNTIDISAPASVTENIYAGQVMVIVPTAATPTGVDGKRYHIVSHTTTVLTLEEAPTGLGGRRGVVSTMNMTPTVLSNYFGHVEETELPERKLDTWKGFYKGSSSQPWATEIIPMKASYESSIPIRVVNGLVLAMAFGHIEDNASGCASYSAGTVTSIYPTIPGQKTITTTAAHGMSIGSFIQIGDASLATTEPEIRKLVTGTTGSTLVLDKPLRRAHPAVAKIASWNGTVGAGEYVKHTLKPSDSPPSWSLKRTLYDYKNGHVKVDYCKIYRGLKVKSCEVSMTPGDSPLQISMGISGLSIDDTQSTREAIMMDDYLASNKYIPPFIHKGGVTKINDVTYLQSGDFSGSFEREMDTKYYFQTKRTANEKLYDFLDPFEHIEGLVNSNFNLSIPLHNKNFWEMLKAMTTLSGTVKAQHTFSRSASDKLEVNFYDPILVEGSEGLPRGGEIPTSQNFETTYMEMVFYDAIEYY